MEGVNSFPLSVVPHQTESSESQGDARKCITTPSSTRQPIGHFVGDVTAIERGTEKRTENPHKNGSQYRLLRSLQKRFNKDEIANADETVPEVVQSRSAFFPAEMPETHEYPAESESLDCRKTRPLQPFSALKFQDENNSSTAAEGWRIKIRRKTENGKSRKETCWKHRPLRKILRVMLPVPLRFEDPRDEEKFASTIQHQLQRNIWWTVSIPVCSLVLEFVMTRVSTPQFAPLLHTPHLLYTVGTFTLVMVFTLLFILSHVSAFIPLLESCLCISGCLYTLLLPLLCDHYRVAALLGLSPQETWGRDSFSDGPVLMALTALLFSVAIFIPVRDICLWPVCLVAVASFQAATLLTGGADGLRPSIINGLLLMLLAYLALAGRRALELQLRLQCQGMIQAQASVEALRARLATAASLPPPPTPPTALESVMNSLEDSLQRMANVKTALSSVKSQIVPGLLSSANVQHYSSVSAQASKRKGTHLERLWWRIERPSTAVREQSETSDRDGVTAAISRFLPSILSSQRKAGSAPEGTQRKRGGDGAEGVNRPAKQDNGEDGRREAEGSRVSGLWGVWMCTEVDQVMQDVQEVKRQLGDLGGLLKVDISAVLRASLPEESCSPSCASSPPTSPVADGGPALLSSATASNRRPIFLRDEMTTFPCKQNSSASPNFSSRPEASSRFNPPLTLSARGSSVSGSAAGPATSQSADCNARFVAASSAAPVQSVSVFVPARQKRERGRNASSSAFRLFLGSELSGHGHASFQPSASSFRAALDGRHTRSISPRGTDVNVLVDAYATLRKKKKRQTSKTDWTNVKTALGMQTWRMEDLHEPASLFSSIVQGDREGTAGSWSPSGQTRTAAGGELQATKSEETQKERMDCGETWGVGERVTDQEDRGRESNRGEGRTRRRTKECPPDAKKRVNADDGSSKDGTADTEVQDESGSERDSRNTSDENGRKLKRRNSTAWQLLESTEAALSCPILLGRGVTSASESSSPPNGLSTVPQQSSPAPRAHRPWTVTQEVRKDPGDEGMQLDALAPMYFYIGDEEDDGTGSSYRSLLLLGEPQHQDVLHLPGKQVASASRPSRGVSSPDGIESSARSGNERDKASQDARVAHKSPAPCGLGAETMTSSFGLSCRPFRSSSARLGGPGRCGSRANEGQRGRQQRHRGRGNERHRKKNEGKLRHSPVNPAPSLDAQMSSAFVSYFPLQHLANQCARARYASKREHPYRHKLPNMWATDPPASGACLASHFASCDGGETASGATDTTNTASEEVASEATDSEETASDGGGREKSRKTVDTEERKAEARDRGTAARRAADEATEEQEDWGSPEMSTLFQKSYVASQETAVQIERLKERIGVCWSLDLVQLHACTGGRALQTVGESVLCLSPSISSFFRLSVPIPHAKTAHRRPSLSAFCPSPFHSASVSPLLCSFLETLSLSYHATVPYHNSVHGADVAHMLRCLLRIPSPRTRRSSALSSSLSIASLPSSPLPAERHSSSSSLAFGGEGTQGESSRTQERQRQLFAGHTHISANSEEGSGTLWGLLSPTQKAASMIAALAHDVGHPGTTNAFEMNRRSLLALTYNDNSVLEQFHSSVAFFLLHHHHLLLPSSPHCSTLERTRKRRSANHEAAAPSRKNEAGTQISTREASEAGNLELVGEDAAEQERGESVCAESLCDRIEREEYYRDFRKEVIELIVHTDMTKHFSLLALFKVKRQTGGLDIVNNEEDRSMLLKMLLKAADIGHATKAFDFHFFLSCCLIEEFHRQGDEEKKRGMVISPLCDRQQELRQIFSSQAGFLQVVCLDFFSELADVARDLEHAQTLQLQSASAGPEGASGPRPASSGSRSHQRRDCAASRASGEEGRNFEASKDRHLVSRSFSSSASVPRLSSRKGFRRCLSTAEQPQPPLPSLTPSSPCRFALSSSAAYASGSLPSLLLSGAQSEDAGNRRAPPRLHPFRPLSGRGKTEPSSTALVREALPPQAASAAAAVSCVCHQASVTGTSVFKRPCVGDIGSPPGLQGRLPAEETKAAAADSATGIDPASAGEKRRVFSSGVSHPFALPHGGPESRGSEKSGNACMRSLSSFFRGPKARKEDTDDDARARQKRSQTLPSSLSLVSASRCNGAQAFANRLPVRHCLDAEEPGGGRGGQDAPTGHRRILSRGGSLPPNYRSSEGDQGGPKSQGESAGTIGALRAEPTRTGETSDGKLRGTEAATGAKNRNAWSCPCETEESAATEGRESKDREAEAEAEEEERLCQGDFCEFCRNNSWSISRAASQHIASSTASAHSSSLLEACVTQIQRNKHAWEAMAEEQREPPRLLPADLLFGPFPRDGVGGLVRRHLKRWSTLSPS
ncbi:3'5'-cyclic nucleotide phosphodiesterase domain-containing protein [Toxoplasma gondii VAND]|uniref:Phosphodiesterase n=1 Tax=Toxoplasma gondii VAND TaxID=933077 RepID=A0A086PJT8_TOXGO|nr:3'5'-cyclic nucleotide phosphodiesterase domain-containing protein [Toxoplasma gondii VAND]